MYAALTGVYNFQLRHSVVLYRIIKYNFILNLYIIQDLVGNNNNSIANFVFYLTKKSNQPEDGS